MYQITEISDQFKKDADKLLQQTEVLEDLKKYGEVIFTGSYAGNVMMHGDIDISVVRDVSYTAVEVLDILKSLYLKGKFRSYFIKGDWDDERKGKEFPLGHYIGMKQRLGGIKWKIDVWFIDKKDYEQRKKDFLDIGTVPITEIQRKIILEIKNYRNENDLDISGQEIYEAVLNNKVTSVDEFIKN